MSVSFARSIYPLRIAALFSQFLTVITLMWQYGARPSSCAAALMLLVWPHAAYLRSRGKSYTAELDNFTVDGLLAGLTIPAISFSLLPTLTGVMVVVMNALTVGGVHSLGRCLVALGAGALVSGSVHGFHIQLETTPLTVMATAPTLVIFPALVGLTSYRSTRQLAGMRRRLRAEQEENETLLLNVLPPSIALRLKKDPGAIADHFDEVTVLFGDIVGFTKLAQSKSAGEVVQMLNSVFSKFDAHVDRLGLEKIKTIGDAYMVAAGIPTARVDHAEAVAEMALAMITEVEQFASDSGQPLSMRIGIHTGSVVAGIIGKKKFSYDLWGDTVNTASRMESHGIPGQVQISEAVREKLGPNYVFEDRGEIEIKGKGMLRTFLLRRR